MKRLLLPGERSGEVRIPASKSQAHRLLICAALSGEETRICCDGLSKDILATVACLRAMGAEIREEGSALRVRPIRDVPTDEVPLPCGESGSTLRFLLPVVGALGIRGRFLREGRLPERPLAPLDRELTASLLGFDIINGDVHMLCNDVQDAFGSNSRIGVSCYEILQHILGHIQIDGFMRKLCIHEDLIQCTLKLTHI